MYQRCRAHLKITEKEMLSAENLKDVAAQKRLPARGTGDKRNAFKRFLSGRIFETVDIKSAK